MCHLPCSWYVCGRKSIARSRKFRISTNCKQTRHISNCTQSNPTTWNRDKGTHVFNIMLHFMFDAIKCEDEYNVSESVSNRKRFLNVDHLAVQIEIYGFKMLDNNYYFNRWHCIQMKKFAKTTWEIATFQFQKELWIKTGKTEWNIVRAWMIGFL